MNKCDNCHFEGPTVYLGDGCPECGKLVGWPVPAAHSRADELVKYNVEATDEALAVAVKVVAERNYATLLRRKRKAEQAIGIGREQGTPPNAEPEAAAANPAVQPQPDGVSEDDSAVGSEAEGSEDDQLETETLA